MLSDVSWTLPPPLEKVDDAQTLGDTDRGRPIMVELQDQAIVAGVWTQLQQAAHDKKYCLLLPSSRLQFEWLTAEHSTLWCLLGAPRNYVYHQKYLLP